MVILIWICGEANRLTLGGGGSATNRAFKNLYRSKTPTIGILIERKKGKTGRFGALIALN